MKEGLQVNDVLKKRGISKLPAIVIIGITLILILSPIMPTRKRIIFFGLHHWALDIGWFAPYTMISGLKFRCRVIINKEKGKTKSNKPIYKLTAGNIPGIAKEVLIENYLAMKPKLFPDPVTGK